MKGIQNIIIINDPGQVPALETIRTIQRGQVLKLVFEPGVQNQRIAIGQSLQERLVGFLVSIPAFDAEINITQLITDQEIEDHQVFFEQCAKDYRQLAGQLLFKLVDKLGITLNEDFPLDTFYQLMRDKRHIGQVENWKYFFHGFHCGFRNVNTGQYIEVSLVFGLEFGDLDPYFFTRYIKSTPAYQPIPVEIFEDYDDGVRINEKMLVLGKFESIPSNVGNHFGIVVTDRDKVAIKSHEVLSAEYKEKNQPTVKPGFSLLKFLVFN